MGELPEDHVLTATCFIPTCVCNGPLARCIEQRFVQLGLGLQQLQDNRCLWWPFVPFGSVLEQRKQGIGRLPSLLCSRIPVHSPESQTDSVRVVSTVAEGSVEGFRALRSSLPKMLARRVQAVVISLERLGATERP
jgi:hypothetical protein